MTENPMFCGLEELTQTDCMFHFNETLGVVCQHQIDQLDEDVKQEAIMNNPDINFLSAIFV